MDEVVPKKSWKVFVGVFFALAVIIISIFVLYVFPSIRENREATNVENIADVLKQTPPSTSLSNEDAEILIVWMYLPIKLGKYCDEYASTADIQNADDSEDRNTVITRLGNLITIAHTLPTNAKYKPLTDSIKAMLHKRVDLIVKGEGMNPLDEETQTTYLENLKKYAADIRYATDIIPKDQVNRVLNRYYGTI